MVARKAAERYSQALLELARSSSSLDIVQKDLVDIGALIRTSPDFARFLTDYLRGKVRRLVVLKELFEMRVHQLTWCLILLLEEKKRMALLRDICGVFPDVRKRDEGIVSASVLTSFQADQKFVAEVSDKIRKLAGRPAEISIAEKKELIGGLQFQIGDTLYDLSVKGLLDGIRRRLAGT